MEPKKYIDAWKIVNTHGVKGEVKIEVWLDSPAYFKTFPRVFLRGKEIKLLSSFVQKGFLVAKLEGIDDINAAMALKETVLQVARSDAHLAPGGYFLGDLIGFSVVDEEGEELGRLKEIFETPASPVYVVQGDEEHLIPGVPEFIRKVDLAAETITVHRIGGM